MIGSLEELRPKNIIVRMPNWIGDLVMATPVLRICEKHTQTPPLQRCAALPYATFCKKILRSMNCSVSAKRADLAGVKKSAISLKSCAKANTT